MISKADKAMRQYEEIALTVENYERVHAVAIKPYQELLEQLELALLEAKEACRDAQHDVEGAVWVFKYVPSTKVSYDGTALMEADPTLLDKGVVTYFADKKKVEELFNKGLIDGSVVQAARREVAGPVSIRPRRKDS